MGYKEGKIDSHVNFHMKNLQCGEDWESLLIAIAGDKESYTKEEVLHAMWMTEQETIWEQSPDNPMNQ